MSTVRDRIIADLARVGERPEAEDVGPLIARARAEVAKDAAHKARLRERSQPRRDAESATAREASTRALRLRSAVRSRAMDLCELCPEPMAHVHHLEGGRGTRRPQERASNLIALCLFCHAAIHDSPREFVGRVRAWATSHGYPLPNRKEYRR